MILLDLGVEGPAEIDLEAIAWTQGAKVRYRPLRGCEARIFGHSDAAIISVNAFSSPTRKRFSLAHELGHWHHHRGKLLFCRSSDIGGQRGSSSTERVANRFAADLLMPPFMFDLRMRALPKLNFASVDAVANEFSVSRTAAAIRLVERDHSPSLLVCHGRGGLKWFTRSPSVPDRWWPQREMDAESHAFDVLFGRKPDDPHPRTIGADAWFDRREAERYELREQTARAATDESLTLLLIEDPRMLDD